LFYLHSGSIWNVLRQLFPHYAEYNSAIPAAPMSFVLFVMKRTIFICVYSLILASGEQCNWTESNSSTCIMPLIYTYKITYMCHDVYTTGIMPICFVSLYAVIILQSKNNSTQHSSPSEIRQVIICILWYLKFHYRVPNSPPLDPILRHLNRSTLHTLFLQDVFEYCPPIHSRIGLQVASSF